MYNFLQSNNLFFQVKYGYYITIIIFLLSFIRRKIWFREAKQSEINRKMLEAKAREYNITPLELISSGTHEIPRIKEGLLDRILEHIEIPLSLSHYLLVLFAPIYCAIALPFSNYDVYHFLLLSALYGLVYYLELKNVKDNSGGSMLYLPLVFVLLFAFPVSIILIILKRLFF